MSVLLIVNSKSNSFLNSIRPNGAIPSDNKNLTKCHPLVRGGHSMNVEFFHNLLFPEYSTVYELFYDKGRIELTKYSMILFSELEYEIKTERINRESSSIYVSSNDNTLIQYENNVEEFIPKQILNNPNILNSKCPLFLFFYTKDFKKAINDKSYNLNCFLNGQWGLVSSLPEIEAKNSTDPLIFLNKLRNRELIFPSQGEELFNLLDPENPIREAIRYLITKLDSNIETKLKYLSYLKQFLELKDNNELISFIKKIMGDNFILIRDADKFISSLEQMSSNFIDNIKSALIITDEFFTEVWKIINDKNIIETNSFSKNISKLLEKEFVDNIISIAQRYETRIENDEHKKVFKKIIKFLEEIETYSKAIKSATKNIYSECEAVSTKSLSDTEFQNILGTIEKIVEQKKVTNNKVEKKDSENLILERLASIQNTLEARLNEMDNKINRFIQNPSNLDDF